MNHFFAIILLTGAATLSLELLASRILTPYFGVSLYIWSGILSITLIALAIGYWWGGRICRGATKQHREELVFLFSLMPAVSCVSLLVACLLYPKLFLPLAQTHLVIGSFFACMILLFVPLVCLSTMNPILVALFGIGTDKQRGGDSGAGLVFFVSTLGSVAGVLGTAFILIPNLTNFRSVLLLAFCLSTLSIWPAATMGSTDRRRRRIVMLIAFTGALLVLLLFFASDWYLKKKHRQIEFGNRTWRLLDETPTFFGNIKVVQMSNKSRDQKPSGTKPSIINLYLTDASVQSMVDTGNAMSQSLYIYALESLGRGVVPRPNRILVLGLGAGCLPTRYASDPVKIDVVEINPAAAQLAEQYFHFDPSTANLINADARVYARDCEKQYDLIYFDLFQTDSSTPEYLLTIEFMHDLAKCLSPRGAILFNMASIPNGTAYFAFLKTVGAVLPELRTYYPNVGEVTNVVLLASRRSLADVVPASLQTIPRRLHNHLARMLFSRRVIDHNALSAVEILTDDGNLHSFLNGGELLKSRRAHITRFPREFLVN